jgi:GT2 family glycosyltransferase
MKMKEAQTMPSRIKIGIATYKDTDYLALLLQSIRWYTVIDEPYDIVVCDDGSPEDIQHDVQELCDKFGATCIMHEENKGIPATWNHLTVSLGHEAEIIVLLNNDLLVVPQWLKVAVHFLDANKDNHHLGSTFWNPINRVPLEMMRTILPTLGSTTYTVKDAISGKEPDFFSGGPMNVRVGENQGLGKVMCPCGCCFAFRREVFNQCGPFNEGLVSFHEESHFGTTCAASGRGSYGFAYPRPYHTHGYTFGANPELEHSQRMQNSRAEYRRLWNVPDDVGPHDYFKYVDDKIMPRVPKTLLKYLRPDYTQEPVRMKRNGDDEGILLPALVEFEEQF